ncbi:MAG: primosomal protein N' [Anaerolineae bacterium]|nr:primosomal protein N' [Anaerolineae bacterium]
MTHALQGEDTLTRAWHYQVPEQLRSSVRVGQLVWVRFGSRYLQGIIIAFDERTPVSETRPLDRIVDAEPVLSPAHLDLARWVSEYYMTPMHRVILSMLPPGITQTTETIVSLVPGADVAALSGDRAELAQFLQARGPMPARDLRRELSGADQPRRRVARQVNALVREGYLLKETRIRPPRVRPKLSRVIRLHPDLGPLAEVARRAPRQRAVLHYLEQRHAEGQAWVPVSEIADQTGASSGIVRALLNKELVEESHVQVWRDPLSDHAFVPVIPPKLTPAQSSVWERVRQALDARSAHSVLLQGVTGSGKTEIYLRAAQHVLRQGRGALVLVPEIALTPQTIRRFGARFPTTLAILHSGLSAGERYDQWHRIRAGELRLVIGARSAIFAPIRDLGLIVLDEEHEWSYKQENPPRYHTRDVAIQLAELSGATCILGSATPSLESAYRAECGEYAYLHMPDRIMGHRRIIAQQRASLKGDSAMGHWQAERIESAGAEDQDEALYADLPPVSVVDMRAELRAGNRSILSRVLQSALSQALAAGEQTILFLNRRGSATFVMCRDCGHVLQCPRCDVPLTYHARVSELICHHCNYRCAPPAQCPNCWSRRIRYFGTGTQRVEEMVQDSYPQARIVRWDLDTTGGRQSHGELLDRFIQGEADIMVGTQMIAKGLDLPRVTLVGVITADTMLNLPDLRASERTFQLLTQVAGRAGRSILGGRVIIQTYTPQHPAIVAASQHDFRMFYEGEIAFRREHWYPPFSRLIRLVYSHPSAERAAHETRALHARLEERIARLGLAEVDLIGPAPAFFARVRGESRWHVIVRGADPHALLRGVDLPTGWRVDVDPVSLL